MVDEEREYNGGGGGTSCGGAVMGSNNGSGFAIEVENGGSGDGNSAGSSGECFRTYKRRKHTKMGDLETKLIEDGKVSVDSASQSTDKVCSPLLIKEKKTTKEPSDVVFLNSSCEKLSLARMVSHAYVNGLDECSPKNCRNIILEQMYHSLSKTGGSLQECIQDALASHPESGCKTTVKESVHFRKDGCECPSQAAGLLNGTQNAAAVHMGAVSNGLLNESNHTITEQCQRAFFDIIVSENFTQLCTLLSKNFQGMKVDSLFDINFINSRMKKGAYDSSPMLFHSDIQQVWTKLQKVGTEMVALAKTLSDKSRTSYRHRVGGSVHSISKDGKHEESGAKLEQKEACGMYKVCTCRHCGEKADGRDCLVCDSCEGMYHVSCIEPAVEEIPLKSWYCASCTSKGIESPHENCVMCERLNAPKSLSNGDGVDEILTNEETLLELEESSNGLVEDGFWLLKGGKSLPRCKICGNEVENGEKFRICGHCFCPHKYYHERCLTSKQLNSYGSCWYCPSCLCRTCLTDRDDDKIVLCDGCDQAYHIYCMQPPRTSIPRGKWFCRKCDAGIQRIRKAKRAYENLQDKLKKRALEGHGAYENLKNVQRGIVEEALDKSGGVDMLLTAAKTLNYEENLAAIGMKS